jgi:hypothetical protein
MPVEGQISFHWRFHMIALVKLFALGFVTWIIAMLVGMLFGIPFRLFLPEDFANTVSIIIGLTGGLLLLKDSWIDLGEELGLVKKKVKPTEVASKFAEGKEEESE